jgi:hypothetical protein
MQDFNVIIDGIKANTNMIEEDVIRQRLGLEPKEQKGDDFMNPDNTNAMMDITEILKKEPQKACKFIECNAYRFTKEGLADILTEVLRSLDYHVNTRFYGNLYTNILGDVQIELDEKYDDDYVAYQKWIDEANAKVKRVEE